MKRDRAAVTRAIRKSSALPSRADARSAPSLSRANAKAVNATPIPLDQAPQGYEDFDKGAARKFVLDPHGILSKVA